MNIFPVSKAETRVRELTARNGRNEANSNAGIPTGSPLHLAEMLLAQIDTARAAMKPRPASEYHEDMGPVLWWRLVRDEENRSQWAGEPPYVGTPLDLGIGVRIDLLASTSEGRGHEIGNKADFYVGGWTEGYYTHFTPIIMPDDPATTKE